MSRHGGFSEPYTSSWQPPGAAQQFSHGSSSGAGSAQTAMPWGAAGLNEPYQPHFSASQLRSAPAAAAGAGAGSFNYGFGQAGSTHPPQPSYPPYSHPSTTTQSMSHMGSYYSTQPAQQQQFGHQGFDDNPAADSDDLKLVKNLPAPFQPIFKFRCGVLYIASLAVDQVNNTVCAMAGGHKMATRSLCCPRKPFCCWPPDVHAGTSTQSSLSALRLPAHQTPTW